MSEELVTQSQLKTAIEGGASYAQVVKTIKSEAVPTEAKKKANLAARKKAYQVAVANTDRKVMARLRAGMRKYVSSMADIQMEEPRELLPQEARDLMQEVLSLKEIKEFLESRNDTARELVFTGIDEALRAKGIDEPETQNGEIRVPELGKVFKREGAGYKDATLDLNALERELGDDASKVFIEKTIPAKVIKEVDEEALGKLIMDNPEILEKVRKTLIPGTAKPAKFVIRDLTEGS